MGNDTQTLTLSEFLLARIADDEARYTRDPSDYGYGHDFRLAECEAKRRIVERVQRELTADLHNDRATDLMWRTLEFLALPYADHPDYRQEWAP